MVDALRDSQLASPGVLANLATVSTAKVQDASVQLSAPTASRYGTSRTTANSVTLSGVCSEVDHICVCMGVERGFRSFSCNGARMESVRNLQR